MCYPWSGTRKICCMLTLIWDQKDLLYMLSLVWDQEDLICVTLDPRSGRSAITLVMDQEEQHDYYEFILGLGPRREDEFILGQGPRREHEFILGEGPRREDVISLVRDQDEVAHDRVKDDDV